MPAPDRPAPDRPAPDRPAPDRPRRGGRLPSPAAEDGAQALELAAALPILLLFATIVVAAGQVALGLVVTNQTAVLAARLAATRSDAVVTAQIADPTTDVSLQPPSDVRVPGDLVTATITRRIEVLWLPGPTLQVRAQATALTEQVPEGHVAAGAGS